MAKSMKPEWDEFAKTQYYIDMLAADPSLQKKIDAWTNYGGMNEGYLKSNANMYGAFTKWKTASAADTTARESYLAATSKTPGRSATILSSLNNGPKTLIGNTGPVDLSKTVLG